jgi:hypothetical protein
MTRQRLGRREIEEAGHKRGKKAEEKRVKHRTKAMKHQVNCLAQKVENNGRSRAGPMARPLRLLPRAPNK